MNSIRTVSSLQLSRQLLAMLASAQTAEIDHLLDRDASMQIRFANIHQTYQSQPQVCKGLAAQTNRWPRKPFFNVQYWDDNDDSVVIQFDVWDRPFGHLLHSNCSLSITLHQDKIKTIKLSQGKSLECQTAGYVGQYVV